ncbi:MAG: hypothetical protein PF542_05065 [Nanoarchaeota archaeon]|jgi:hypothetical protein|nr:hypothetical protein [Nanoarchaeota archaeon]
MTKVGNYIAGAVVGTILAFAPKLSSAQSLESNVQKGIGFQTEVTAENDSLKFYSPLNKSLQTAFKGAADPYLIKQGFEGNIAVNKDTTGLYITVPKTELGKTGIIGVGDHSAKYDPCSGKGLGSSGAPIASTAITFDHTTLKIDEEAVKGKDNCSNETYVDKRTFNDNRKLDIHFHEATKQAQDSTAKQDISSFATEHYARLNTFLGSDISLDKQYLELNPQVKVANIGKGKLWTGPYARGNLEKEVVGNSRTDFNVTTEIEKSPEVDIPTFMELRTNSTGFESFDTKTEKSPMEFGWNVSYSLPKFNFDLFAGVGKVNNFVDYMKKGISSTFMTNTNTDQDIPGSKDPFCIENSTESSEKEFNFGARASFNPIENTSVGLEVSNNGVFATVGASLDIFKRKSK